jgi:tRNA (uracil-5-)-methyltransferase TRM9
MLNEQLGRKESANAEAVGGDPRIYHRYYHMFDEGELRELVCEASEELGLVVSPPSGEERGKGVRYIDIVQDGWEKSNFYVELRLSVG